MFSYNLMNVFNFLNFNIVCYMEYIISYRYISSFITTSQTNNLIIILRRTSFKIFCVTQHSS